MYNRASCASIAIPFYIMASYSGTLYVGYTSELFERVMAHKAGEGCWFTTRYGSRV